MKRCNGCNELKTVNQFSRNKAIPDGYDVRCKECQRAYYQATKEARRAASRRQYNKHTRGHPEKIKEANQRYQKHQRSATLQKKYGITLDDVMKMYRAQEGRCKICKRSIHKKRNRHVDHIHGSKPIIIRGLLCGDCNRALGSAHDSISTLRAMIKYLQQEGHAN